MKLAEVPLLLARMRADRAAWSELAYRSRPDDEDVEWPDEDMNWRVRRACLLGLQHDRRSDDRDLISYLLDQEICARRASDGCGSSLEAAIFFVAEFEDPSIAWRIRSAKYANQDTRCTIDLEALYCCGVERTLTMLATSECPERDDFLPAPQQDEVDAWWARQRDCFPRRWEDEPDKVGTCEEIGDLEAAADYLRQQLAEDLAAVEPGSSEEQKRLVGARYEWRSLGRADEAAKLQTRIDEFLPEDPWDRASALRDALQVYTAAGQFQEAASKVEPLLIALMQVDCWRDVGLGRMSADAMADLAIATPDEATAARVFTILEAMIADGLKPAPILHEKLAALAARLEPTG